MNRLKWDGRYLDLAKYWSQYSKDPSTQVGAVVVKRNAPVGLGFNGLPENVEDTHERLNNRELKYKMICHGEQNAMTFAHQDLTGCTLYTWPFMPCSVCAGRIIQEGIRRVVAPYSDNPRWQEAFAITQIMFNEAGVSLVLMIPSEYSWKYQIDNAF